MTSIESGKAGQRSGWIQALGIYRNPRVTAMLFLGFSAGLPFALTAGTLTAWLTREGVSMSTVGMFAWVGILYAFKFIWSPLVDQIRIPLLTRTLGRRRSWMLTSQLGVAAALVAMAYTDPANQLLLLAWFAMLVAFCSATQDIAVDAWRIEVVDPDMQGAMAASYQLGYRIALLASGAGALLIGGEISYPLAYQAMALLMGVGMITVMVVAEPRVLNRTIQQQSLTNDPAAWVNEAIVQPFAEFFRRNAQHALIILLFISIYRISDMVLGVMANPFYLVTGFSEVQIAGYVKTVGLGAVLGGAAIGGVAVARFGLGGPLVFGAIILALTNLSFAGLALVGADVPLLVITICADNLAQGFTGTVFIAYLSSLTNVSYTATQYALFTSLMVLPGKILSGYSGQIVDAIGWVSFFIYAALMGVPAVLLAVFVNRHLKSDQAK
ncbi:MAG: MFS transporter [Gammaproteobacteria bacterium]|jgi:PAT family beta-lactamase induction signal transducer AmpG|nr:AmpG family muropeptide MFS transporter [Chromatiales bacterium]MDP6150647.1 MFS transporter [Gammaproteobacteria bacterium]MDP7153904.1 MFS transporter [Gammaproteobacteria bacterium]MDP7270233.1 MFS transporter [Gammaproteobacteria bacterium]HJP05168.1 MFS transporter [Gammaproteobacteria bacterium]